jgi:hypothetical protein
MMERNDRILLTFICVVTSLVFFIATDYAYAYAVAQLDGLPGGWNLWALVQEGGRSAFIGLLFYLWLYERSEARKECSRNDTLQKEKEVLHERVLNTLNTAGNTLDDLVRLLSGGLGGRKE